MVGRRFIETSLGHRHHDRSGRAPRASEIRSAAANPRPAAPPWRGLASRLIVGHAWSETRLAVCGGCDTRADLPLHHPEHGTGWRPAVRDRPPPPDDQLGDLARIDA